MNEIACPVKAGCATARPEAKGAESPGHPAPTGDLAVDFIAHGPTAGLGGGGKV